MSATSPGLLTTSRATFPVIDVENLQQVVAEDLVLQVLRLIELTVKKATDPNDTVFLDELEHVVVLPNGALLRWVHVTNPVG